MPDAPYAEMLGLAGFFVLKNLAWYSVSQRKKTQVARVKQIILYPIKSGAGIQLTEADIADGGIRCRGVRDRSYVIISTKDNRFVSLKMFTQLAKVQPALDPSRHGRIRLTAEGHPTLPVPLEGPSISMDYKGDPVDGVDCGDAVAKWLGGVCGRDDLRLVYCPDSPRSVRSKMRQLDKMGRMYSVYASLSDAPSGNHIAFADKAPILMLSDASFRVLNEKLASAGKDESEAHGGTDWRNFRPNLVVSDVKEDRAEDSWGYIFGGDFVLTAAFPCERCPMVNLDHTREKVAAPPGEPVLSALRDYRSNAPFKNPLFGVYCVVNQPGSVGVGQPLYADK